MGNKLEIWKILNQINEYRENFWKNIDEYSEKSASTLEKRAWKLNEYTLLFDR